MRMKNMRKPAALLMMVILTLSMLAGCMSPLGRALEREKHLAQADELDLDEILSDSEGYHFPGLTWNMTIKEIREATGAPLNAVQGYSEAGEVIYTGDGMLKRLLDCKNDETCVTVDQDGVGFMVSLVYMNSADKPVTRPMTLEELFNQYKEKLKEKFGEPEEKEAERDVNGVITSSRTAEWTYTTAQGLTTHLQLAAVYVSTEEQTNYISLGFVKDK